MSRNVFILGLAGIALISSGAHSTIRAQAAASSTTSSAQSKTHMDGVYTEEQAKRGEPLYTQQCASCHNAELSGGPNAPPLIGGDFNANWNTMSLGEMSERIRTTMPPSTAGSLTRRQTVDIIAFLLSKWKAPAGTTELPTQADALSAIKYSVK